MNLLYFIPLVVFFILLFIKKYKFEKNEFINTIFWALLSILMTFLFIAIISKLLPNYTTFGVRLLLPIVYYIFVAALPEELSKFCAIKLSRPRNKNAILVNAILISLIFMVIEDFGYFYDLESKVLFNRILTPGHLLFQLIMVFFLFKAFDAKENNKKFKNILYSSLAILIPVLIHGVYDSLVRYVNVNIFYVIGIITYILTIVLIIKMKNNDEIIEKKKLSPFSIIKIIIIVLLTLFFIFAFSPSTKYNSLNTEVNIKEDNISITVLKAEQVEINDMFDFNNGTFTKVKIRVKNKTDIEKNIYESSFDLYDGTTKIDSDLFVVDKESLPSKISANSEVEGYVYFKCNYNEKEYLVYTTDFSLDHESHRYYFNIGK